MSEPSKDSAAIVQVIIDQATASLKEQLAEKDKEIKHWRQAREDTWQAGELLRRDLATLREDVKTLLSSSFEAHDAIRPYLVPENAWEKFVEDHPELGGGK